MGMAKDRLIYSITDVAESDQVGAFLLASDGTEITSTNVGGKDALDVYIAGASGLGIFAEDSAHNSGDLGQQVLAVQTASQGALAADGDYAPLQVDPQGRLRVLADLDLIGDLTADDLADDEDPLKIGSRAIDGLLGAVSAGNDKANAISDMYRRIYVAEQPQIGQVVGQVTVGATEVAIPTTAMAGRKWIVIQNRANNDVFIGPTGVTTTTGLRVAKGATYECLLGEELVLYGIAAGAGNAINYWEKG